MLMLCESFNYFSLSLLFVLYLTQEFGVGDVEVSSLAIYVAFTRSRSVSQTPAKCTCCISRQISVKRREGHCMGCGVPFW